MDGVLVDSEEAHFTAWRRLFEEESIPYHRDLFRRTFGQRNDAVIRDIFGADAPMDRLREMDMRKESYYRELIPSMVTALPGALALLNGLTQSGARQAIGSSGPLDNVIAGLEALGMRQFFDAIAAGHEVETGKPAPDIFLLAAKRLNVPATRCLVLEDAPQGVEAALAAGMRCVAVTSTRPAEELARAHRVVGSLTELTAESLRQMVIQGESQRNA